MARQPYFVNTSNKILEVFSSFGGGMVSQAHPEKLNDNESVLLENADIVDRDIIQSRGAYSRINTPSTAISGNTQGHFLYVGANGAVTEIVAINGSLYTVSGNTYTALSITNLASFQTTRPIEAVQLRNEMYIATGSGLVVYDGSTASLVQAYAPNPLEALYIGTNGYALNPDSYLSDMTGAANSILGVVPSLRYGVVNKWVTFTAYVETVSGDVVEYMFETKRYDEVNYTIMQNWDTKKDFTTIFSTKADYMIRVSLRKQGTTTVLSQYVLPRYKVNSTPDEKPEPGINFDNIKLCNRLFIHYDRLFLYGDTSNPDYLYSSHLNKFDYFPRTNIMIVSDPLRGGLNSVVRYKSFIVCFTDGSIQAITGKSPQEFEKFPIHTTMGTKKPYSVQVMKNYIAFVGNDNGIYVLRSFNYASDDKMSVERIDLQIKDALVGLISSSSMILSCIYNNQYYLYIENGTTNYIYRYYYEFNRWVRDNIGAIQFMTMMAANSSIKLTLVSGGSICQLKKDVFTDDVNTSYSVRIISKDFDFRKPHHRKKLKQYQILAGITSKTTINVKLYTDNTLAVTTSLTSDPNQNSDAQKLKIMANGRFRYVKSDITIPVNEVFNLIGFGFVFKENTPK